jgi:pyruvate,water dikinase
MHEEQSVSGSITYELPDPAYEAYTWILQDEHMAGVQAHLSWDGGIFPGGRPGPDGIPMQILINGFPYARPEVSGQNPFGRVDAPKSVEDLVRWREELLPRIDELAARLEGFDPAAVEAGQWESTLQKQERDMWRVFSDVHLNTVINGYLAVEAFTNAYVERFGEEARPEVTTLLQGFPNLSIERAAALWDLSRVALADDDVLAALEAGTRMPDSDAGRRFESGLAELMRRFGYTTNIGGSHLPTWREDPSIPLALVKAYARLPDDRSPRAAAAEQARARAAIEQKLDAAEPSDSELLRLLEMAQQYLPNLEDHNLLCDQRVGAAIRERWLAIGRRLQARGQKAADDVFYYRRPELLATLEGGDLLPDSITAERRAFVAALAQNPPPPRLGKPGTAPGGQPAAPTSPEPAAVPVIRGVAASKGVYTGRAQIIETLDDAWRLEQGDVLVCRMTSPPWSPLFATIGALVVNTGGMLSHGAVVAREFGIPAVVATTNATSVIPDGATVTVDGTNGVVTVNG